MKSSRQRAARRRQLHQDAVVGKVERKPPPPPHPLVVHFYPGWGIKTAGDHNAPSRRRTKRKQKNRGFVDRAWAPVAPTSQRLRPGSTPHTTRYPYRRRPGLQRSGRRSARARRGPTHDGRSCQEALSTATGHPRNPARGAPAPPPNLISIGLRLISSKS